MIEIYVKLVEAGLRTIEQVPFELREEVQRRLNEKAHQSN